MTYGTGKVIEYKYDELDRIQEICYNDNNGIAQSYKYVYTATGAVSSQTILSTETYRYDNSNWRDQITQIETNGVVTINFTYDDLGNPTTYSGYTLTWDGRRLMEISMTGGQFRYTFTYNDEGLRTSKTAGGYTHKYVWEGSTLVSESWGKHFVIYLYDESGSPIGMQYRDKTYDEGVFDTYYFEKNLQGDIIAVYNAAGNKLGSYTYDAWGNFTTSLENTASSTERRIVNTLNPFRYRGYYYDIETGLYYLQSRYYNPQWGRFLNADGYVNANGDLVGFNMYAYCSNNPVMYSDPFGESILLTVLISALAGAAIGAAIKYVPDVISEVKSDGFQVMDFINPIKQNWKEYTIAALKGGVNGAAFGLGLGLGTSVFTSGISLTASSLSIYFGVATAGSFVSGMGIYALETKVLEMDEYNTKEMWQQGLNMGLKGAMNFGMGWSLGSQGYQVNYTGIKGLAIRSYMKSTIVTPVSILLDGIFEVW